jgi:hypothetical protein
MSDVGIIIDLDDESIDKGKVVLDYTSRDFNAIRAQLIGLAKGLMPDWQTAGEPSDFGTLILELFAYMGDVMHFYIDRTASEAFLSTAVRRQSILYIADMMGYIPIGQQAASVALTWTIAPDDPEQPGTVVPVTIPVGTRVYNQAGNADELIVFETATEVMLDPKVPVLSEDIDRRSVIAYANEGTSTYDVPMGTSSGLPNTELVIPDKGVIYGTVEVTTREGIAVTNWTYVTHLSASRPTQAVFTTFMDEVGLTHIVFGDNAAGRIPPVNAQFYLSYRYGVGAAANSLPSNSLSSVATIPNVDLTFVTVTNRDSPVGGTDPESIDSMRFSISRGGSKLRQRAVTLNDYAELAMQVPGVAKSVAYGAVYTAVHVRVAPINGKADANYMQRLINSIYSYMQDKIMIGSQVYPEPLDSETLFEDIQIRVLVHVQDAYDRTAVRLQVDQVVRSLLSFENVDFGSRVSIGLVYRAVLAVQGVEYADLQWLSTEPPPNERALGSAGIIEPDSATSLVLMDDWNYSTSIAMADPSATNIRLNNAANPTIIALANTAAGPTDVSTKLGTLQIGDHIVITQANTPTNWLSVVVTAAITANTGWKQIPVVRIATSLTPPVTNTVVNLSFIRYSPNPTTPTGDVNDINTDELLIPRILPPLPTLTGAVTTKELTTNVAKLTLSEAHGFKVGHTVLVENVDATFNGTNVLTAITTTTISYAKTAGNVASIAATGNVALVDPYAPESETDFPGMTEDERTHDGLWVKAVGGLANT